MAAPSDNTVEFRLKLSLDEFTQALKAARTAGARDLKALSAAATAESRKVNAALGEMQRQRQRLGNARQLLGVRDHSRIAREIDQVRAAYNRLARSGSLSQQALAQAQLRMKERIRELRTETNGWSASLSKAHGRLIAIGAAAAVATAGLLRSGRSFGSFAERMAEISTLLDATPGQMEALGKAVRALSVDLGKDAAESAQALYDIISAGVGLEESVGVLELATKAAVAGVTDTQTAARIGLAVINAYGMGIDELKSVYDTLFMTVKNGVTTLPELAAYLGDVLPVARAAGVDINTVSAAIAQMTKAGIRTPQAITALKSAITALSAPTPEAARQLQELGVEWNGLIGTLEQLQRLDLPVDQLRRLIPDVEARTAVLSLTASLEGLVDILDEIKGAEGALLGAYGKMADTPIQQVNRFKAAAGDLSLELGALVSTAGTPLLEVLTDLLRLLGDLPDVLKAAVALFGMTTAAAVLLYTPVARLVEILPLLRAALLAMIPASVMTRLAALTAAAKAAVAALGAFLAANPLVLAALGAAAAATAGWYYWTGKQRDEQERINKQIQAGARALREFTQIQEQLRDAGAGPEAVQAIQRLKLAVLGGKIAHEDAIKAARKYTTEILQVSQKLGTEKRRLANLEKQLAAEVAANLRAQVQAATDILNARKAALREALAAEQRYTDEAKGLAEQRRQANQGAEDRIRDLLRQGMSERQRQADIEKQIHEELAAARKAAAAGDQAAAREAAQRAQDEAAALARLGNTTREIEANRTKAVSAIREGQRIIDAAYAAEIQAAEKAARAEAEKAARFRAGIDAQKARVQELKTELDALTGSNHRVQIEADIAQANTAIDALQARLDELREGVHIPIHADTSGPHLPRRAQGGPITGPGGPTDDKVLFLGSNGEYVLRAAAVRHYGLPFIQALNDLRLPGFARGGLLDNAPIPRAPAMPAAGTGGGLVEIRLDFGRGAAPVVVHGDQDNAERLVDLLEREGISA